jgi:very-short-patch-repair endonuclease
MATLPTPADLCAVVQANAGGERAVNWIAARQLALVTTAQLRLAGVGRGFAESRCAKGSMRRLHRGVYVMGSAPLLPGARELAAVLACGGETFVSHRAGAFIWGLAKRAGGNVDVTVVGRHCRSRPGLSVHRPKQLDPRDRAVKRGIPVTAPARTLVDLAATAADSELERAIAEAYALRIVTRRQIEAAIARASRHTGIGTLRDIVTRSGGPAFTRSQAERRMLGLIRQAQLAIPRANARLAGREVDFFWPAQRLVVEVDGHAFHGHRLAFERDRRRDAMLVAAGYRVIRVTWRQLTEEPLALVASVAQALGSDV